MAPSGIATNSHRRRILAAIMACVANPAFGHDTTPIHALLPQLRAYVAPALHDLHARRYGQAEERLKQANALIETAADTRWPYRLYVLVPYAFAVGKQGRQEEALTLLRQAVDARERILLQKLPRFAELVTSLDVRSGLELMRVEYGRQFAALVQTSQVVATGDLAQDLTLSLTDPYVLMAMLLHGAGHAASLQGFYRDQVRPFAPDEGNLPLLAIHEYRLHAYGLALAREGLLSEACDAWRLARHCNARRLALTTSGGAPHSVIAACGQRRILLGQSILAAHAAGQLESEQTALLSDILHTKSAGTRYMQAARQAIARQLPAADARLVEIEDRIAALPATVTDLRPFGKLFAEHDLVYGQAMRSLPGERPHFPASHDGTLGALQAQLDGKAAIGFMLAMPAPDATTGGIRARYLRYCITSREVQLRLLDTQDSIDRHVYQCRTDFLRGAAASPAAAVLARELLAGLPSSARSAREWIIDPDGALHLLPFDALPGDDGKPVLCRYSVRLVTSLLTLLTATPGDRQPHGAVIIANPDYSASTPSASGETPLRWGRASPGPVQVAPLPDTHEEAQAAMRALSRLGIASELFEGDRATAQALGAVPAPAVLHIAAHAVLRSFVDQAQAMGAEGENMVDLLLPGRQAGLLLSRDGQADIILAKDLARLPLQGTALVVLSACDTANGEVAVGEGVASLRQAVELAGARSTVAAVWSIPSAATTALMSAFYERLAHRERMASALRSAKLEAYASGAPPRDWAGLQFSGLDHALKRS